MFYHPLISRVVLAIRRPWLMGKRVLVGITDISPSGDELGRRQFAGRIAVIDLKRGICLQLKDASHYWMPPDHRVLKRARRGEYRLRSTGEVVVDPDFLANWTICKGPAS